MTIDLSKCKIGNKAMTRDGAVITLVKTNFDRFYPFEFQAVGNNYRWTYMVDGTYDRDVPNSGRDIVKLLQPETPSPKTVEPLTECDALRLWREGKEIEVKLTSGEWVRCFSGAFGRVTRNVEFRLKPKRHPVKPSGYTHSLTIDEASTEELKYELATRLVDDGTVDAEASIIHIEFDIGTEGAE